MQIKKLVTSEIILIIASVFIFRGLWGLLDRTPIMNTTMALLVSFLIGIMVSIPATVYVVKKYTKKN